MKADPKFLVVTKGLDLEIIPVQLIAESTGNSAFLIIPISRLSLILLTSQVFSIKIVSIPNGFCVADIFDPYPTMLPSSCWYIRVLLGHEYLLTLYFHCPRGQDISCTQGRLITSRPRSCLLRTLLPHA